VATIAIDDAKARGLKRYFTGTPCKHGHIAERFTSCRLCCECDRLARLTKNMTPQQVEQSRARQRVANMTPAQVEATRAYARSWAKANEESVAARNRQYRANWTEEQRERERARTRVANLTAQQRERVNALRRIEGKSPERVESQRAWWRAYYSKLTPEEYGRYVEGVRRYQAARLQATPVWADVDAMAAIYAEARRLTRKTGEPHHVDHMVPLVSSIVCGLHVPANLQVLRGAENLSKGNRYWDDMP
jgi:hypothetical protein